MLITAETKTSLRSAVFRRERTAEDRGLGARVTEAEELGDVARAMGGTPWGWEGGEKGQLCSTSILLDTTLD